MVKHCCWGTCKSDSRHSDRECMSGVNWIPFPKPFSQPDKCRKWVSLCGRKGFTPNKVNKATYICSKHFVKGTPTLAFPDPVPASGTLFDKEIALKGKRRLLFRDKSPLVKKKKENTADCGVGAFENHGIGAFEEVCTTFTMNINGVQLEEKKEELHRFDHDYLSHRKDKTTSSVSCQTDITMTDLSSYEDIQLKCRGSMRRSFVMGDVLKDDKSCKFYTGVSLSIFMFLLQWLTQKASRLNYWRGSETNFENNNEKKGPKRLLTIKEEMVLTLLRLRRGLDTTTLGAIYGIQPGTVSKIFFTWISFLYMELRFLISWPTREQTEKRLPACFKYFPKTRCIIDCTEFFVQKPSLPSSQRITWSCYKHHNTFKALVGITPTGSFSFVSNLYTGSISDKKIVEQSGFLDQVERGDDIMADRGFLIRGNLALKGATLNIPPFAFNKQLSGDAVTKTRRIARAKIHVERAIGRLKCFCILQGVIPLKLKPVMDHIVCVCAILCNLDKQLVK